MTDVLTINGGSSSIRFSFYAGGCTERASLVGKLAGIGSGKASLTVGEQILDAPVEGNETAFLINWLRDQPDFTDVAGIGHRVVHGMQHVDPQRVTTALLDYLKHMIPYDPEHLPREIELITAFQRALPDVPQVVCFDTAFHRDLPSVASRLPIPRRYANKGIRRYGFHGLSYTYLLSELERLGDSAATQGRVILAHLGSGCSLAAVRNGRCVDTTMGFTPTAGLVMSTRTGDMDPGVMNYLAQTEHMDAHALERMVNHESGLLGISETSADIRTLLSNEATDFRAREAVETFCYQARKWIGAFTAVLGGLDTVVLAGGIGENSAPIRSRICSNLEYLGLNLNETMNAENAAIISADDSGVCVRVIKTDEESVIAAATRAVLKMDLGNSNHAS